MKKIIAGIFIVTAIIIIFAGNATAAPSSALTDGETAIVASVTDGDTVVLNDGRQVRLLGLQAPKLPLGRANFIEWPLAKESKSALDKLVGGKSLQLKYGTTRIDRHGRVLANLYLPDGTWINASMIGQGMARVYSFADNRLMIAPLLQLEQSARGKKLGIWGNDFYAPRNPTQILDEKYQNSFQIVTGKITEVAEVKKTIYINFGENWRDDFTAVIPYRSRAAFTDAKIKPKDLAGKTVRVRGWISEKNGPMMELTHPEQLEIVNNNDSR